MSVWSKLFGDKADLGPKFNNSPSYVAPNPGAPTQVVLVRKKLALEFHAHDSAEGGTGNFLSVISEGLNRYKQRELAITLRLGPDEDPTEKMRGLGRFFGSVWRWAQEGVLVDAGDVTQFGERGLFGAQKNGLVYADARGLGEVLLPADALAAVMLNDDEVRVAMSFGAYRLLARLGEHYGQFPFPTWTDLARPSLARARDGESQLAKVKRIRARGVSYLVQKGIMRVSLPTSARAELAHGIGGLTPGAPFALLTDPAPDASALSVWYPGQEEPRKIAAPGSEGARVTGSFLVIVPGGQNNTVGHLEDGQTLLFSSATWQQVAQALLEKRPLSLQMAGGLELSLEWQAEAERTWLT